MEETIGFFSSDYRNLYKSDIFLALGLPRGYVIHFRYQKKYIDDALLQQFESDKESIQNGSKLVSGVIFYTSGTNPDAPEDEREIKNTSIREVTIKNIEFAETTDLVHFFLELGDFVDCKLMNETEKPIRFVSNVKCRSYQRDSWASRIENVKDTFRDALFFLVSSIKEINGSVISPRFSLSENKSIYELEDEKDYNIELAFYDDSGGSNSLKIKIEKNNLFSLDTPDEIQVQAIRDNRGYRLTTFPLDVAKSTAFVRFESSPTQPKNLPNLDLLLQFTVKRQEDKPFKFGMYSFFAFLALATSNAAPKMSDLGTNTVVGIVFVSSVVFAFATGALYTFFNKK